MPDPGEIKLGQKSVTSPSEHNNKDKDKNSSPYSKFYRFLFPFSSKFSDLNISSCVLFICSCDTRSEPGPPVDRHALLTTLLTTLVTCPSPSTQTVKALLLASNLKACLEEVAICRGH